MPPNHAMPCWRVGAVRIVPAVADPIRAAGWGSLTLVLTARQKLTAWMRAALEFFAHHCHLPLPVSYTHLTLPTKA